MSYYVDPETVLSPKNTVSNVKVLYTTGVDGFSIAEVEWAGNPVLAIRWNGGEYPSNPLSRGIPVWFLLPDILELPIKSTISILNKF